MSTPVLQAPATPAAPKLASPTLAYAPRHARLRNPYRRPADVTRAWGRLTVALASVTFAVLLVIAVLRILDESYGGLLAFIANGLLPGFWGFWYYGSTSSPVGTVLKECLETLWPAAGGAFLLLLLGVCQMMAGYLVGRGSRPAAGFCILLLLPWGPFHAGLFTLALAWMLYARYEPLAAESATAVLVLGLILAALELWLLVHWWHLLRDLTRLRRCLIHQ